MNWVPITERLPNENEPVIVTDGKEIALVTLDVQISKGSKVPWWNSVGVSGYEYEMDLQNYVTHWIYLELPNFS